MDAMGEHLKALRLHWLANVKDAVRLNQVGWFLTYALCRMMMQHDRAASDS